MSVVSTGWVARNYNSRGLNCHNINHNNLVRSSSGILWAAIRENIQSKYIRIYRSTNNGFSWDVMWAGNFTAPGFRYHNIANLNTNGSVMNLVLDEHRNRLVLFHSMYNQANSKYQVEPFIFKLTSEDALERVDTAPNTPSMYNLIDIDMDQMVHVISQNDDFIWLSYTSYSSLRVMIYRADEPIVGAAVANLTGSDFFNIHDTCVDDNNHLDIAVVEDRTANYAVLHYRYSKITNSWSTAHQISEFPKNNVHDIQIKRDGLGHLMVVWSQYIGNGTDIGIKYASSNNDGLTWSAVSDIPKTSGHGNYTDRPTQQLATRNALIGIAEGGFIVSYVRSVANTPMCYWRRLVYNSGSLSYDRDTEYELSANCSGAKFFHPTSTNLINGAELQNIRVGYTVGEGTSTIQIDNVPVSLQQKTLDEGLDHFIDAYVDDSAGPNQLEVSFNVLGSPNENVDYYAEGLKGTVTDKYIGTSIRMYNYEPNPNSYLNDRSAYFAATEYSSKAVFNAVNYNLPIVTSNDTFTEYMERDTRVIYLPPTFHLFRNFVLNKGQFLKRTVWTAAYDGNMYELTQVIPFFLNSEIAYYTANAYVIGPSNDPFSRPILPTET
jgi:hypothetical protein